LLCGIREAVATTNSSSGGGGCLIPGASDPQAEVIRGVHGSAARCLECLLAGLFHTVRRGAAPQLLPAALAAVELASLLFYGDRSGSEPPGSCTCHLAGAGGAATPLALALGERGGMLTFCHRTGGILAAPMAALALTRLTHLVSGAWRPGQDAACAAAFARQGCIPLLAQAIALCLLDARRLTAAARARRGSGGGGGGGAGGGGGCILDVPACANPGAFLAGVHSDALDTMNCG
jgi:hypothetical protein